MPDPESYPQSYVTDSAGRPLTQPPAVETELERRVMVAIILAQPELNGVLRYSALRAGLAVYEQYREGDEP
jgi:hypothetical protein